MTSATAMPDKKAASVIPVIQVEGEKQGSENKHKTWAIVAVVIALIVVGGITAAVTITLHYTSGHANIKERTVTVTTDEGTKINETIRINEDTKTERLSVRKQGMDVMYDFSKGLTMHRMPDGKGSHYCVLTKLERNSVQPLDNASAALDEKDVGENNIQLAIFENTTTDKVENETSIQTSWYQFAEDNVEERTYLGVEMRELCEGNPIFWGIKLNKPDKLKSPPSRQTRAIGRRGSRRCFCIRMWWCCGWPCRICYHCPWT